MSWFPHDFDEDTNHKPPLVQVVVISSSEQAGRLTKKNHIVL